MKKLYGVRDAILYDVLGMKNREKKKKLLALLNLNNLKKEMNNAKFPKKLIVEIIADFNIVKEERGESEFREWIYNLHYQIPELYQNDEIAKNMYTNYGDWIEREITKLEHETELSWQEQSTDFKHVSIKARKAQLVLRHRISDVVLNVLELVK